MKSDKAAWLPLWHGYLTFYETQIPGEVTDLNWERFFNDAEKTYFLGAYDDGAMVGFATYLIHGSTWAKHGYCYLEDLFVAPEMRGRGVARALIAAVEDAAREAGCPRLYWITDAENKTAQTLYDKVAVKTSFLQYRKALD